MATTKLPVSDITLAELPRGMGFQVLVKGPELYCQSLRAGATVALVAKDGEVEVTLAQAPTIGPLANFVNTQMLGMTTHYANKQGRDPMAMFDSLEAVYPKDPKAVDPRTIYSCVTVDALPFLTPGMAPTSA